jgi:integrase
LQRIYSETQMASLVKRPDGSWQAQIRRRGVSSSKTFAAKKDAAAWARDQEARLDRGELFDASRRFTFSELLTAYRRHVKTARAMSRSKDQALDNIERMLGTRRLAELKTRAFLDFAEKREKAGAGPATILQDFSYVGTALRHGAALLGAEGAVGVALASLEAARLTLAHAGRIARPEERDRRPTDNELSLLLAHWAASPRQSIPMVDLVPFAVATAMRLGEILGLQWSDFDPNGRTVLIRDRKHPTKKAGNDQRVPLLAGPTRIAGQVVDPVAIIERQRRPDANGRIFPFAAASVSSAFTRAVAALGIEDLHFHDLRHDGASRLFEAGFSIEQVALLTGHRDWNMLRRYTQLQAAHVHEVHARMEGRAIAADNVVPIAAGGSA